MTVTTRLSVFIWLAACVSIGGCNSKPPEKKLRDLPYLGMAVEIAAPIDLELRELWEPVLQEWQAATGASVVWSEYDVNDPFWNSEPNPEGSNKISAAGRVVVLALADMPRAEEAGIMSPVPAAKMEAIADKDLFPGLVGAVLSRDRKLIAAPVSAPVLLCYYRRDLLEAAGREPPATWNEYQDLVDELDQWAPKLSVMEPCGPEFLPSLFLARSLAFCKHPQSYSVWFDIQTGEPLFDAPGFERALEVAQTAWKKMPAEIWTASPVDCRQAILEGRAALALTWEPSASYPRSAKADAAAREVLDPLSIGVVALPGSDTVYNRDAKRWETLPDGSINQPGLVGFTGLAIGVTASEEKAAAWNLFEAIVKHQPQAFADRPRSPCRESETGSALFGVDGTISPETAGQITDATAETLRRKDAIGDLTVPQAKIIRELLARELARMKDPAASPKEVLAAMNSHVAAATEADRAALRAAYRRSLGLSPLK